MGNCFTCLQNDKNNTNIPIGIPIIYSRNSNNPNNPNNYNNLNHTNREIIFNNYPIPHYYYYNDIATMNGFVNGFVISELLSNNICEF